MNSHDVVPPLLQSLATALPPMRGPVVHDPENPGRRTIGFLGHDLIDQSLKRIDPGGLFTAPKDLGSADIPSRQVSKGACPLIFVFHLHRSARSGSHTGMPAPPSLDAGLFVCRQHAIGWVEPFSLPEALIQIQDASRFLCKARISGKDPAAMVPGRIASSDNQRQRVVLPTAATRPRPMASCLRSARLSRDRGRPNWEGSSQASALISTTTSGGKARRSASARGFLQPF